MGVYANLHKAEGSYIPEEKREEFAERLEKVFQSSGMMDSEYVSFFGIDLMLIRKASMHDYGMEFTYNYFDDDFGEKAGYSTKENRVWSGETGGRRFTLGVCAAYLLEEQYTEGASFVISDGDWLYGDLIISWINYLFDEEFVVKDTNFWKMCEIAHYENESLESNILERAIEDFSGILVFNAAFISQLEHVAVYEGIRTVESGLSTYVKERTDPYFVSFANLFTNMLDELRRHKDNGDGAHETETDEILELLDIYYGSDISEDDYLQTCNEKGLYSFGVFTTKFDFPVFAVKIEAENYDKDFWALWDRVRKTINLSKRTFPEHDCILEAEPPLSTKVLFQVLSYDMIPYWTEGGKIHFPDELENWFLEIKKQYDIIVGSDIDIADDKLKWIVETLNYANKKYYRIYAFADFFYETLDNLDDRRYLALWKLFEDMLHDPELQKAGGVIYLKDNEERTTNYLEDESEARHRNEIWKYLHPEMRFNEARKILRQYMALVANKELRNKVFGF